MENRNIEQPLANLVYSRIIYTLSIVAAVICTLAPILAIALPERNILNPQFLFSSIWKGASPGTVWHTAGSGFPGGHFWLNHITFGDGIIQFGVALAGSCAGIALLGAAIAYLKQKPRNYFWVLVSLVICAMIFLAAVGIYTQAGS